MLELLEWSHPRIYRTEHLFILFLRQAFLADSLKTDGELLERFRAYL